MPRTITVYPEVSLYCAQMTQFFPCTKSPSNDNVYLANVNIPPNTGDTDILYEFEVYTKEKNDTPVGTGVKAYLHVGYETIIQYYPVNCVHLTPEEIDENGGTATLLIEFGVCMFGMTLMIVDVPPNLGNLTRFISSKDELYITGSLSTAGVWWLDTVNKAFVKTVPTGNYYNFYETAKGDIYVYNYDVLYYLKNSLSTHIQNTATRVYGKWYESKSGDVYMMMTIDDLTELVRVNKTTSVIVPKPDCSAFITTPHRVMYNFSGNLVYDAGTVIHDLPDYDVNPNEQLFIYSCMDLLDEYQTPIGIQCPGYMYEEFTELSVITSTIEAYMIYVPSTNTIEVTHVDRYLNWVNSYTDSNIYVIERNESEWYFIIHGFMYDKMSATTDLLNSYMTYYDPSTYTTKPLKYDPYNGDIIYLNETQGNVYIYKNFTGQLIECSAGSCNVKEQHEDPYDDVWETYLQEIDVYPYNPLIRLIKCDPDFENYSGWDTYIKPTDGPYVTGIQIPVACDGVKVYFNHKIEKRLKAYYGFGGYKGEIIDSGEMLTNMISFESCAFGTDSEGYLRRSLSLGGMSTVFDGFTGTYLKLTTAYPKWEVYESSKGYYIIGYASTRSAYYFDKLSSNFVNAIKVLGNNIPLPTTLDDYFSHFFKDSKGNVYISGINTGLFHLDGNVATEVIPNNLYLNWKQMVETPKGAVFITASRSPGSGTYKLNGASTAVQVTTTATTTIYEDVNGNIFIPNNKFNPVSNKFESFTTPPLNPLGRCTWNMPASGSTLVYYNCQLVLEDNRRFQASHYSKTLGTAVDLTTNATKMLITKFERTQ